MKKKQVKVLPKSFELTETEVAARTLLDGKAEVVEPPEEPEMDCEEFARRVEELLQPLADAGLLVV
jgi:hypothetical protein